VLPGVIGVLQANEALKIVVGYGEPLIGRLVMFDAQATTFRSLKLRRDPACATCGKDAPAWQEWEKGAPLQVT
jgi:molybdopterin/thiamine biosynthesis adenylyltransferase